jgi:hypothetical protein
MLCTGVDAAVGGLRCTTAELAIGMDGGDCAVRFRDVTCGHFGSWGEDGMLVKVDNGEFSPGSGKSWGLTKELMEGEGWGCLGVKGKREILY